MMMTTAMMAPPPPPPPELAADIMDRGITLAHRLRDELMAAEAAKAH